MPEDSKLGPTPHKAGGSQTAAATTTAAAAAATDAGAAASDATVLKLAQDELMAIAACMGPSDRRVLRLACKPWRAATDTFTATPTGAEVALRAPTAASTDLRSTPPAPPLPSWLHNSVRRVQLSFNHTPELYVSQPLSADDQAALTTALSSLRLGSAALLRSIPPAAAGSGGADSTGSTADTRLAIQQSDGQAALAAALHSLHLGGVAPHHSTPAVPISITNASTTRTLALAMDGYQAPTKAIEDALQQAGMLGAWPQVEVRPGFLLLDGHLSQHLVMAEVMGLATGYVPGHAQSPAPYSKLRHLELTLHSGQDGKNVHLLLNQHMLPNLRHLQFNVRRRTLLLPMAVLDLPSLHSLVLDTDFGTSFDRPVVHEHMSPYCGLTMLTQLTRLVYTPWNSRQAMRGISMLEALPSLKELELAQVPTDTPFGHLTSLTHLSISFSNRLLGPTWDMVGMIGHLTALRSLTLDSHGWASGSGLQPGALPALTELCFQGLNRSTRWDSLASALLPLANGLITPCAYARQESLRKVRLSPVRITSPQSEEMHTVAGGWAWAVKKQEKARPGSGTDAWEVEFEATDAPIC